MIQRLKTGLLFAMMGYHWGAISKIAAKHNDMHHQSLLRFDPKYNNHCARYNQIKNTLVDRGDYVTAQQVQAERRNASQLHSYLLQA